jgi:hypothetical protein
MRRLLLSLSCFYLTALFYSGFAFAGESRDSDLPRIIIITLSGVRNTESISDPTHQYFSNLWSLMLPQGVLYTHVFDTNYEFHMPVVDAINTGINTEDYDSATAGPKIPSLYQYIRKKYGLPAYKTWSIGHWYYHGSAFNNSEYGEETCPCEASTVGTTGDPSMTIEVSPELKELLTPQENNFIENFGKLARISVFIQNWDSLGDVMYQFFNTIIRNFKPCFIHYVMVDPESAHYDSYGRYVLALQRCDQRIYEIWRMIQNDPYYNKKTYLIVTVDHERNQYYMHHTEKSYDNPSCVWMYLYGPNVRKGELIDRPVQHIDVFATIVSLLKLKTHATQGNPLTDCFTR